MTCALGHDRHDTLVVPIDLGKRRCHDTPDFPRSVAFEMEVFDWPWYSATCGNRPGWCPGRDSVSEGLVMSHVWEAWETRLVVEVLERERGIVLDYGANLGWYTLIANETGHWAMAVEADHEIYDILRRNTCTLGRNTDLALTFALEATVGPDSDAGAPPADLGQVRLLKADVEGAEFDVVRLCRPLFEAGRIDFALLEISPVFKPGYGELLAGLLTLGYEAFGIPDKTCTYREEYSADPLAVLRRLQIADPIVYVAGIVQANVMLARRGLVP